MRFECQASDPRGESREYIQRERGGGWEIREAFKPWRIIEYSRELMKLESHVKLF